MKGIPMNKEDLKRLISQYQRNAETYRNAKEYNEQDCRDEFISPLLECLGWDVHNKKGTPPQYKEVVVEKFSNENERPDYTLTLNGVSKIFIEAKKPSVDIRTDKAPAFQARKYGWNAKHKISVLTNFEDLIIYDTTVQPYENDYPTTSLYRCYHYLEYLEHFDGLESLLSRDSVYSGRFDEFISSDFQDSDKYKTEIDDIFLNQINQWRLGIGKYLYATYEGFRDIDYLNDKVQEFINQIIFLRICEDRNLPVYKSLKEAASNKEVLQNKLLQVFKDADKRYNSGLFAGKNIVFDLNNTIIFDMIMSLYYPQAPYMFNIIEPGILGKIYESFLTESLVLENNQIQIAAKKEYKDRSVVSTPVEIVKYMVKAALEPYCADKTPDEILDIHVADIACGSGVFLEEAYQFLIDYCVEWYMCNQPEHLLELSNGRNKLPLSEKKNILVNCIYGVDIDIHAVEVSRFSLLIKLIEDETMASVHEEMPILPDLQENIRCGNSLISRADLNGETISVELLREIRPFNWDTINDGQKFNIIIGNPPYVKTEDIHSLETDIEFNLYKKGYKSAYKQFDKYFLFIEKAMDLLKEDGLLCYIIPNKFFKTDAGTELRRLLSSRIKKLDDFGDLQLFPDKTIYSSIVLCGNTPNEKMEYTSVSSVASLWAGEEQDSMWVKNSTLNSEPWRLTTDIEFMKMVDYFEDYSVPLGNVVEIFNGIQTSAERPKPIYWFGKDEVISENDDIVRIKKFNNDYSIEKKILKPYFKPTKSDEKGMQTYSLLKTDKRIIFPYTQSGELIDISTLEGEFPGTYEYLLSCYDRLVPKCLNDGVGRDIPNATSENWYQYGRTQALTAFINTPKLIVRVLSKVPMYAFDTEDMLIASGGTAGYCAIAAPPDCQYDLSYVQAWLNHPYTEKLLQIMGSDFEGGFTARGTYLLKRIPFIGIDFDNQKEKAAYDDIVSCSRKIYALNDAMDQKPDKMTIEVMESEKNNLISRINDQIGKIYRMEFR